MAFITLPPSLPSSLRRHTRARFRMQEASEQSAIAPLNGAQAHEMKEVYAMKRGGKAPVCRCWQSAKFPLCDGSHNKFNKATGSHVGPLVVNVAKE